MRSPPGKEYPPCADCIQQLSIFINNMHPVDIQWRIQSEAETRLLHVDIVDNSTWFTI